MSSSPWYMDFVPILLCALLVPYVESSASACNCLGICNSNVKPDGPSTAGVALDQLVELVKSIHDWLEVHIPPVLSVVPRNQTRLEFLAETSRWWPYHLLLGNECTRQVRRAQRRTLELMLLEAVQEGDVAEFREIVARLPEFGIDAALLLQDYRVPLGPSVRDVEGSCRAEEDLHVRVTLTQHAAQLPSLEMLQAVEEAGGDVGADRVGVPHCVLSYEEARFYPPLYLAIKAGRLENALWLLSLDYPRQFAQLQVNEGLSAMSDPLWLTTLDRYQDGALLLLPYRTRDERLVNAMLSMRAPQIQSHEEMGEALSCYHAGEPDWWPSLWSAKLPCPRPVILDALDYEADRALPAHVLRGMQLGLFDLEVDDEKHESPFLRAARANNKALFEDLLDAGIGSRDDGHTYLSRGTMTALAFRSLFSVPRLTADSIEAVHPFAGMFAARMHSEDIYAPITYEEHTVLHILARDPKYAELLTILLARCDKGPDVVADHGATPLYEAINSGCVPCAIILSEEGADDRLVAHRFPIWRQIPKDMILIRPTVPIVFGPRGSVDDGPTVEESMRAAETLLEELTNSWKSRS